MNDFISWINLQDYVTFVGIVVAIVQVTKDIKFIKKIATKYWSILVAFILIILTNIKFDTFQWFDLVIYLISSIFISLSANGVYDFKVDKKIEQKKDGD